MKVSEVMTRDVRTVRPDQSVREAANFMLQADAGAIPVTDGDRLIGMITDRDIAVRGVAEGHGPDTLVRELMTNDIVAVRVEDDTDEVAVRMGEAQVRRLPRHRQPERSHPNERQLRCGAGAGRREPAGRTAPAVSVSGRRFP